MVSRVLLNPWYITRAAGLLAYLALWLSVIAGLLLSSRRLGPAVARMLGAIHPQVASWAIYATVVHVVILRFDQWISFRWVDLVLPLASSYKTALVAMGIYSLYAMLGVQVTSYLRAHMGTPLWRLSHTLSFPAYLLALAHGIGIGTDTGLSWVRTLYGVTGGTFALVLLFRMAAAVPRVRRHAA